MNDAFCCNYFQIAYVTSDLDRALAGFARRCGIPEFAVTRNVAIDTRSGKANLHFALAFVNEQQIEVIQPAGGADRTYRDALPREGFGVHLHHIGHLTDDAAEWSRIRYEIDSSRLDIPIDGVFGELMHYVYVDTRGDLGHYLEYMYRTPAGRDMFDHVPRYRDPAAA